MLSLLFFLCFVSKYTPRVYFPTLRQKRKCCLTVCKHQIMHWLCSSLVTSLWEPRVLPIPPEQAALPACWVLSPTLPFTWLLSVLETWFLRYHFRRISSFRRLSPPAAFWVGVIGGKFSKTLPISKCSPFTLGWLCQWRENSWLEVILLGCLMSSDLWSRLHLTCFSILGAFRVFSLLT